MAKKHDKHHKLALLGFAAVAALAILAFAFIYLNQTGFGFSIAGTKAFVQSQIGRGNIQVPGGAEDIEIVVRKPQAVKCVCEKEVFSVSTGQSKGYQPFSSNRPLPYGADPVQLCRQWCEVEQKAIYKCTGSGCGKV